MNGRRLRVKDQVGVARWIGVTVFAVVSTVVGIAIMLAVAVLVALATFGIMLTAVGPAPDGLPVLHTPLLLIGVIGTLGALVLTPMLGPVLQEDRGLQAATQAILEKPVRKWIRALLAVVLFCMVLACTLIAEGAAITASAYLWRYPDNAIPHALVPTLTTIFIIINAFMLAEVPRKALAIIVRRLHARALIRQFEAKVGRKPKIIRIPRQDRHDDS